MAGNEALRATSRNPTEALIAAYRAQPGLYDEMVDAQGAIRPHWRGLLDRFGALGDQALSARFAGADRYLRDSGVFYRIYDDSGTAERPWPLSHVPIVISPADWAQIKAGAIQRAELIEAILADCYGAARLIADGSLPAAAVAGSAEFARPLVHALAGNARHLGFYAVDLGRSPAGDWWVIRDRAQAPSGAGYALENRNALARALSDVYRSFDVERLGGFFESFRGWLNEFRGKDDAGLCLLTPGRLNETYFEHAYLARQLGLRLVEGQDLTVRDQTVYLRTIAGLRRVGALWRRVDSDFCDPLELNQNSQLGVPGLVQSVRHGKVVVTNALGSGLAEAQAMMSFLPALAKRVLGEKLRLPNVATWWCGQEAEREYVLETLDRLVVAPAFATRLPGPLAKGPVVVAELDEAARRELVEEIGRRGVDYVGQEVVNLSTTPVWNEGRFEPRPFILRVYVAATPAGWAVMPGGFGLIGDRIDARAVSMQRGARSADAWVLSEGRVADVATTHAPREVQIRRASGYLPSRAADNLFWLARYVERVEATLRVVRALAQRLSDGEREASPDLAGLVETLFKWGATGAPAAGGAEAAAADALFGLGTGGVPALVAAARNAALVIRDRFPHDALRALDDLSEFLHPDSPAVITEGDVLEKAQAGLRIIAAVTGFQIENMNHLSGWRFLQLGHRIERAIGTCRLVRQFASDTAPPECLDALLELAESQRTYRVRYLLGVARGAVLDLVLLDEDNPRSLAFALADIAGHIAALPNGHGEGIPVPMRIAEALAAEVRAFEIEAVDSAQILGVENGLMRLSDAISQLYFTLREPTAPGAPQ